MILRNNSKKYWSNHSFIWGDKTFFWASLLESLGNSIVIFISASQSRSFCGGINMFQHITWTMRNLDWVHWTQTDRVLQTFNLYVNYIWWTRAIVIQLQVKWIKLYNDGWKGSRKENAKVKVYASLQQVKISHHCALLSPQLRQEYRTE